MAFVIVAANFGPRGIEVPTPRLHARRWPLLGAAITIATAVERYRCDTGVAPESLDELVVQPAIVLGRECGMGIAPASLVRPAGLLGWSGPYLAEVPRDPWRNPYVLEVGPGQRCSLRMLGADGAIGGGGGEEADDFVVSIGSPSGQHLRAWVRTGG